MVSDEIASQPACWRRAAGLAGRIALSPGERVAVTGCGTSYFMAMAVAALRGGETDAFPASEFPRDRRYDRVVAMSRSGTTTEVLELVAALPGPTAAITASDEAPIAEVASEVVVLGFADEASVVQTRFATSVLALWRAALGHDVEAVAADGERALAAPLDGGLVAAEQVTFLGRGWTVGLACEAALKLREAAGAWTEAYPAMEYRHGPISVAEPGRVVWMLGPAPAGLADEVRATGATFVGGDGMDPMAGLVLAQRLAVAMAERRGLDPDRPRHLSRSVILER
jgi:fructoselysine-6-P-deglycase FrlB-like protein